MNFLSRIALRTKLALLLALSTLAVIGSIGAGASLMRHRMIDDRIDKVRSVVLTTMGFAQSLQARVDAHDISREQALATFRDDVHRMRFGAADDYLLVQSLDGVVLMHGGDPAREGKPTASKDANGRSTADLARDVLKTANGGTIWYLARKPGSAAATEKVSYAGRFAPWDMVFIAGAWIDDVDAAYRASLLRLGGVGGAILAVTLLAAWLVDRDITHSLGSLKTAMEKLVQGDLATSVPGADRGDEVGDMAQAVLVFQHHLQAEAQHAADQQAERERAAAEKQAALVYMAETIEAETNVALTQVSEHSATMACTADEMHASAARTGTAAQSATTPVSANAASSICATPRERSIITPNGSTALATSISTPGCWRRTKSTPSCPEPRDLSRARCTRRATAGPSRPRPPRRLPWPPAGAARRCIPGAPSAASRPRAGVVTEQGPIACTSVVLAGGAWSRLFCGNIDAPGLEGGIDLPSLKVLGSCFATAPLDGPPETAGGGADFAFGKRLDGGYTIARRRETAAEPTPDSFRLFFDYLPAVRTSWRELRLRISGRFLTEWRTPRRWALDSASPFEQVRVLDPAPEDAVIARARRAEAAAFPAFAAAREAQRWAGLIDVTPDEVPVISAVDALPGFFLATGFSGHGFGIAPGAGKLMADLVTGDRTAVDPAPYRFGRFGRQDGPKSSARALPHGR